MDSEEETDSVSEKHLAKRNLLLGICCAVLVVVIVLFIILMPRGSSAATNTDGQNFDLTKNLHGINYPASSSWYHYVIEGQAGGITSNHAASEYYVLTDYPYSTKPQLTVLGSELDPENKVSYTYTDLNNAIKRIKKDESDTVPRAGFYKMDISITSIKLDANSIVASYKMVLRPKTMYELYPSLRTAPSGAIFNMPCDLDPRFSYMTVMGKFICSSHVMTDYSIEYATKQVDDTTSITNLLDAMVENTHYDDGTYAALDAAIKA